ncbi:Beta-galactosidase-1-like protein 3 [Sciurus carolinensis]|uniref:Beta-galactosidase n=1 Tax=Sciurus carolinensis TaxID=30640 RepID=A0AA41STE6_SCICA|nr:Beta-galactosidase-1-like protein 3 [Sciurus carolinensis]
MWPFLVRLECILFLASAFSVITQLSHGLSSRINQTHLLPSYLTNRKLGLRVQGSNFTLGGFPFLIIAGTIHYFRVPKEYWRDRLLKMKAGGFNTLITAFITMASQLGLWVILCPGPYIGSDLDLGGLPSWLLRDPNMKLRTTYKGFTKAVNVYFDHLIPRILPLQYNRGGPIIAMQVENEYGSYYLDKKYMPYVKKALEKRKVNVLLMTADNGLTLEKGHIKNVLITVHMKNVKKETYKELSSIQGRSPIMMTVYTVTSFDSWGVAHHSLDGPVAPMPLPLDYIPKNAYMSVTLLYFMTLWSMLPYLDLPTKSVKPLTMEQLSVNEGSGQSYGYILYETFISSDGILTSKGHVQDRGQVFLDDKHMGILDHSQDQLILQKHDHKEYHILRILVENQGRLASGKNMNQERKGLTGDIYLNNSPLRKFTIYSLEMKSIFMTKSNWSHLSPLTLKKRSQGLVGKNEHFTLEGQKFLIFGGSIHYFRVPMEYWRDRLLKLKACGFNTVTTAFVLMAAEVGLWVILRPGPYICAEVDLGGLPSWLLQDPKLKLRTTDKGFVEAVDKYFDHLIPRMIPLQYHHGGPVIAVQVENEYGSFDKDAKYMSYVKEALLKRGIVELLLTSDNEKEIQKGSVKGALTTVNMNSFKESFFIWFRQMQKNKPILIMEYWIGWFDSWGKKHHFKTVNDYDAVLTEAGDYTEKYFKLRKLFASLSAKPLPLLPQHTLKTVYPSVRPSFFLPLWEVLRYLNEPVKSHIPVNMENLPINNGSGQSFGFVLYETSICSGGHLQARVHDFGQVFLNDTVLGVLNENVKELYIPEFTGTLKADSSPRDTFLRLPGWVSGFVFINGRNLGRYWNIGPQETLYLPGVWLHPGNNEIILFEKITSGSHIYSTDFPKL